MREHKQGEERSSSAMIPAEELYWAVLEVSELPRFSTHGAATLNMLFETYLPCPIESIHPVYQRLSRDRVLACAARREDLERLGTDQLVLTPSAIPAFVREIAPSLHSRSIDFLVGVYTPKRVVSARKRAFWGTVMALTLSALLLVVGFERRARSWRSDAETARLASEQAVAETVGSGGGPLPSRARLTGELRTLRQTHSDDSRHALPRDAAAPLGRFLDRWPRDIETRVSHVTVTGGSFTVTAWVADAEAAELLTSSLAAEPGWDFRQNAVQRTRDGVVVRLSLEDRGQP